MNLLDEIVSNTSDLCERFGVKRLCLFGSVARGEQNEESDIDFYAEFSEPSPETMVGRYFGFTEAELAALDATSALNLLLAHVVTGEVLASSLTDGETAMVESLDGGNLNILLNGEVVTVDEATVLEGDIVATNGIIHVIDAVLEVDAP